MNFPATPSGLSEGSFSNIHSVVVRSLPWSLITGLILCLQLLSRPALLPPLHGLVVRMCFMNKIYIRDYMGDNNNYSGSLVQENISVAVQTLSVHRPSSSITAQPELESLRYRNAETPKYCKMNLADCQF